MSAYEADLFVIGAGSGGVRAARIAAGHGAKGMIAEEFRIGGTCVIRGCVPKKLYVYASRFAEDFADAETFGWRFPKPAEFDWQMLVAAKEGEISRLSRIYEANLHKAGVEVFEERAEVWARMKCGWTNRARRHGQAYIDCHRRPARRCTRRSRHRTRHQLERDFRLETFPLRLAVVGGGYIAVEFACDFRAFRREGDAAVSRQQYFARLRRDHARAACATRSALAGMDQSSACCRTQIDKIEQGLRLKLSDHSEIERRPGAGRHRPRAAHQGPGAARGRRRAGRPWRRQGRRLQHVNCSLDPCRRRRDQSRQPHPVAIKEGHTLADRLFGPARTRSVTTSFPPPSSPRRKSARSG